MKNIFSFLTILSLHTKFMRCNVNKNKHNFSTANITSSNNKTNKQIKKDTVDKENRCFLNFYQSVIPLMVLVLSNRVTKTLGDNCNLGGILCFDCEYLTIIPDPSGLHLLLKEIKIKRFLMIFFIVRYTKQG